MDGIKYNFGDIVYRKLKPMSRFCVSGILFRPDGHMYYIRDGDGKEDSAFEMELTKEKSFDLGKND